MVFIHPYFKQISVEFCLPIKEFLRKECMCTVKAVSLDVEQWFLKWTYMVLEGRREQYEEIVEELALEFHLIPTSGGFCYVGL